MTSNQRDAYRVQLTGSSGLRVTVTAAERDWQVAPLNVSLTGVSLRVRPGRALQLSLGDEIELTLEFEGDTVTLDGMVCQQLKTMCGVQFVDSLQRKLTRPPAILAKMVMELQRRRVANRVEVRRET